MTTVTIGAGSTPAPPAPVNEKVAQGQSTPVVAPAPVQTSTPVSAPAPVKPTPVSSTPAAASPAPSSSSGGSDGAPVINGVSILDTANHYRTLMGFGTFTYSSTLQNNAAKTNKDDGANQMKHELNSGSMGQVIGQVDNTDGTAQLTSFALAYLGWLCEIADSRLGNECDQMEKATNMDSKGQTGHAEILRSTSYKQIGCNYQTPTQPQSYKGLWTCDFA